MAVADLRIAVVGGTGALGSGLARRWAQAGLQVLIGSRTADKAALAAATLNAKFGLTIGSGSNPQVAEGGDIIVMAVPFAAQAGALADIRSAAQGKIVVETTVPLVPPRVMRVQLPPEGSAAVRAQGFLGAGVTLVSAFHSVAADKLATDEPIDCDVLVFGDDKAARAQVVELAGLAQLRGLHAGPLANSAAAEAMTSVLIFINKHYGAGHSGLRITGALQGADVG